MSDSIKLQTTVRMFQDDLKIFITRQLNFNHDISFNNTLLNKDMVKLKDLCSVIYNKIAVTIQSPNIKYYCSLKNTTNNNLLDKSFDSFDKSFDKSFNKSFDFLLYNKGRTLSAPDSYHHLVSYENNNIFGESKSFDTNLKNFKKSINDKSYDLISEISEISEESVVPVKPIKKEVTNNCLMQNNILHKYNINKKNYTTLKFKNTDMSFQLLNKFNNGIKNIIEFANIRFIFANNSIYEYIMNDCVHILSQHGIIYYLNRGKLIPKITDNILQCWTI